MKYFAFILSFFLMTPVFASQTNTALLKEMFTKTSIEKNAEKIPNYFDKDFKLYSNGSTMDFNQYLTMHQKIYKTPIQYQIRYDEDAWLEKNNKVAARAFITITNPNQPRKEVEVILIAEYKAKKIIRLWELTYPDWSKIDAFKKEAKS